MNVWKDIYNFVMCLSFVDYVFLISILLLLILLVVLYYFIRINRDVYEEVIEEPSIEEMILSNVNEEIKENNVSQIEVYNDEEGELLDLESLTKKLKENNDSLSSCTEYEKDQEEKAIISYDELLQNRNRYALNYEKEEVIDDLIVKKVNLNDFVNKNQEEEIKEEVRVISYAKEEAFLKALKELNSLLN